MAQILLEESAAPSTPATGKVTAYAKTDGRLYSKDDAGVESPLSNGGTFTNDITMSGASILHANASIAAHATTCDPWSLGNYVTLTGGAVTFTALANAPQAGAEVELYMNAAHVFTDGAVFEVDGNANYTAAIGDRVILRAKSTTVFTVHPRKADGTAVVSSATVLRAYLAGCTLSTAGASATMSIAAGQGADSTNAVLMNLSAIAKTTSAWAVGTAQGGIDTGTIANSTWYHFYVIRRPDTGVVDVCFSTNASTPTLPANYTQYRLIGSGKTNGSAQWEKITQEGDDFMWSTPPSLSFDAAGSTTAALLTCAVPPRRVKAKLHLGQVASGAQGIYLSDPNNADLAPSATASPLAAALGQGFNPAECWTNTSGQIRHREVDTTAIKIQTLGWTDLRGKND